MSRSRLLETASLLVIAAAVLLALPAFLVPLGLPIEADAVDYRIPIVQWMLRHHAYPNFPWAVVDDYPMLGELLMAPLYAITPALARLVPLLGYLGLGAAGGALAANLDGGRSGISRRALFLAGFAWILALRPVALQTNVLLVDNLCSCWILWAVVFSLRGRAVPAGLFTAAALATRYNVWGSAALIPILAWWYSGRRWRSLVLCGTLASMGALPFMIRNFVLNHGHPFFPVGVPELMRDVDVYGRGKSLLSFALLPWDLLYTNSFVSGIFDYTLGKLFYVQLFAVGLACVARRRAMALAGAAWLGALAFAALHLLVWFESSQQLRFLVPALVLGNVAMFLALTRRASSAVTAGIVLLGALSVLSVQKDSIAMAFRGESSELLSQGQRAKACIERSGAANGVIGLAHRDGSLGFLNRDFVFLPGHPYFSMSPADPGPDWVLGLEPRPGYAPWPRENPCLMKKN